MNEEMKSGLGVVIMLGLVGFILGLLLGSYVCFHYLIPNTPQNDAVSVIQLLPHYDELQVSSVGGNQLIAPLQAGADPQEVVAGYNALNWSLK